MVFHYSIVFMTEKSKKSMANYAMAYSGAHTAKGGVAIGTSGFCVTKENVNFNGVVVGDTVRYPSGAEAVVTSGTGIGIKDMGRPLAVVGSHVSGGDHIVSTPVIGGVFGIDETARPEGFLVEGYPHSVTNT